MAEFEDRLLPRKLGQIRGQSLLLQQQASRIRLISTSPAQPTLLRSLRPPFPSIIPKCPARSPAPCWGQPQPELSPASDPKGRSMSPGGTSEAPDGNAQLTLRGDNISPYQHQVL